MASTNPPAKPSKKPSEKASASDPTLSGPSSESVKLSKFDNKTDENNTSASKSSKPVKPASKPAAKPTESRSGPKPAGKPPHRPKAKGAGISFGTAASLAVLAALIGGAIGWMGPKIFDPANAAPAQAISKNTSAVAELNTEAAVLAQSTSALRGEVDSLQSAAAVLPGHSQSIAQMQEVLSQLMAEDIEADRAAALTPLAMRLDALETVLVPEGEVDGDAADGAIASTTALLDRLTALESRLESLLAQPPVSREPSILTYRVPSNPDSQADAQTAEKPAAPKDVPYDFVAAFPKAAMLKALEVQSRNREEPSWLRKILSKHVQTDDVSAAQTRAVIDKAYDLTVKGDIPAAVSQLETLNPTLRAAAHQWLIEAKKVR